ncbi:MAG: DUF853 family protein [Nitrospirota bacterium]|nr:DUF853 family protein [Nitrospirota bacterium]
MHKLKLANDLSLPLEVVTQTVAILAKRRAGKSYTMRRLAEQLFKAHQQIVIVDPKGDQWGIRSASSGIGPGLPVTIVGGEHGDVPLEPTSGEIVAKLVVEERVSLVLDLSMFRKNEVAKFMTDFLENLYRMKARECYRTPMMLVIDEADAIAPQKPQHGEERMLGAAEDIVRRGGQRGIGCVLVTQRSAVLNKNVLTQAQVLVALRTIAPQDLAAMKAWIDVHGTPEQCKTLMASLPSLPVGDAWIWSPGWPTIEGIFDRVHVLPIETFDSGATPKPGVKAIEPKQVADVDLEALKRQMAATIEKAKADNPKELRKQLAEHAKQNDVLSAKIRVLEARAQPTQVEIKEVPVITPKDLERLEKGLDRLANQYHQFAGAQQVVLTELGYLKDVVKSSGTPPRQSQARPIQTHAEAPRPPTTNVPKMPTMRMNAHESSSESLSKMARTMLTVLAQHPDGLTKGQILIHADYRSSGPVSSTFAQMISLGWVSMGGGRMMITSAGLQALGDYEPLPTKSALLHHLLNGHKLSTMEKKLLRCIADAYPHAVTKSAILTATQYASSGPVSSAFGKLVALNYVHAAGRSELRLAEELVG